MGPRAQSVNTVHAHAQITLLPLERPLKVYLKQSLLEMGWDRPKDPPHKDSRKRKRGRQVQGRDWSVLPVDPMFSLSFFPRSGSLLDRSTTLMSLGQLDFALRA